MTICVLAWAGCWGLKQWLGYKERQQLAEKLTLHRADDARPVQPWEIERHQAAVTELVRPPQGGQGGMSPGMKCLIVLAAAIYIICPLDFDFVPILGWVDDVAVGYYAYKAING